MYSEHNANLCYQLCSWTEKPPLKAEKKLSGDICHLYRDHSLQFYTWKRGMLKGEKGGVERRGGVMRERDVQLSEGPCGKIVGTMTSLSIERTLWSPITFKDLVKYSLDSKL